MSSGRIICMKRYDRNIIRSMPKTLFVFGDNLMRIGFGGQAAAARGEMNAIGIPTKVSPSAYADDELFYEFREQAKNAFVILAEHIQRGYDVVWPQDGIGTGLARLPEMAPQINEGIERCRSYLFSIASSIILQD